MDPLSASKSEPGRPVPPVTPKKNPWYVLCAVLCAAALYFFLLSPPRDFPVGRPVSVERGSSLRKVSGILKEAGIIRSRTAFEFFVILSGGEKRIRPAYYSFEKKLPVFTVAWRIGGGKFRLAPVVVTVPEGYTLDEMAEAFDAKLPDFSPEEFKTLTAGKEGYLFPDTYFFLTTDGAREALESLTGNYEKKIEPLRDEISTRGFTEAQIVTMASIIEGEANGDEDRALISGILWKRYDIGMPLQADAAPVTYQKKGLPEAPIGNPGLEAILAALRPQSSPYLYYLHDKEGNIHYARNFTEHVANKAKYLK